MRHLTLLVLIILVSSRLLGQQPVYGLSDTTCQDEVLIAVVEGAQVYASCHGSVGSERVMSVSVTNMADAKTGRLRCVSIGFCGPSVVGASAQNG